MLVGLTSLTNHDCNMLTDDEWIAQFSEEVRRTITNMVMLTQDMADPILEMLDDPIENEDTIRKVLGSFGGSIHISSPRGKNRDQDVVGAGREVAWSCHNDECLKDHCTICGRHESNAGDGHVPWDDESLPPCIPKPRLRRDVREDEEE